jgi:capsular exopolysaccharide synthesis family protein
MASQAALSSVSVAEPAAGSGAQLAHTLLCLLSALRYRKNVVIVVMLVSGFLGILYYLTAPRRYASQASLLVNENGGDHLDASVANSESVQQNTMPTFESMVRSAKVLEGALQRLAPRDRIDFDKIPAERWLTALQGRLVARAVRATSILEISYHSQDPQVAANVVRAVVDSYIDFMDRIHKGATGQLSRMLAKERGQMADQLARKQEELLAARRRSADMGFRSDSKALHPMVQRAVYFNDSLIAAQKQRAELEALKDAVDEAIRNGQDVSQYLISVGDVIGRELLLNSLGLGNRDTTTQTTLEQGLLSDRGELNTLRHNFGPLHPEVVALSERIRRTEQYVQAAQERINQRVAALRQSQLGPWLTQIVRQRLQEARQREQMLQVQFEQTRTEAISLGGQMAEIEMLERDVKRLGDMNDSLLNQIASVDLRKNGAEVRVGVLEEPRAAKFPVSPQLGQVVLLTLAGGFALALLLVNALDALDDRFRSPEELQGRLRLPLLSTIQRMTASKSTGIEALATFGSPADATVEGFRTLRTALSLMYPDAHRLVVSSSEPEDGKTTILANLAICYAQAEKKTLLIDADLRRPGLTTLMNLRGPKGLSELLRSDLEMEESAVFHIHHSAQKGLDVLPSGPRPANPAELLGSPRFSRLLAWAETVYDQILIDSPPTLALADTAIVGRQVDGALLVVQPSKNRRHLVLRAAERLRQMKVSVLGVVVNGIGAIDDRSYGYYGYHGYYSGYEGNYKYTAEERSEQQSGAEEPATVGTVPDILPMDDGVEGKEAASRGRIVPRRVA